MKTREPAFTVREGSSSVVAYKYGRGPGKSSEYCLCWYRFVGDTRQRETKTGERSARDRAREIARDLANDRSITTTLSGPARETHLRIEAMASELGIPAFDLVEQAVAAKKRLGASSLLDAVDSHLQVRTVNGSRATVSNLVADFMRRKRTAMLNGDRSQVHIKNLAGILEGSASKPASFIATFGQRPLIAVQPDELQDWLNDRRNRNGNVVGPRRRRHIRAAVVALCNDARKNRHLPTGAKHAAELTDCPKLIKGKEPTFKPEEFDILINGAHRDKKQCELVPAFAIGAFGRMRMSEIGRLDWASVHLFDAPKDGQHGKISGEIDVSGLVAGKTGMARIIEIPPNLGKWLRLYARQSGPVLNPKITRIDNHVRRFAQKLGLKWQRNILRGSCTSYLYALTNDLKYVAAQHGTSERELKREYLERKSRGQGEAWSAIYPHAGADNILDLRWTVAR
jgi:integrase